MHSFEIEHSSNTAWTKAQNQKKTEHTVIDIIQHNILFIRECLNDIQFHAADGINTCYVRSYLKQINTVRTNAHIATVEYKCIYNIIIS